MFSAPFHFLVAFTLPALLLAWRAEDAPEALTLIQLRASYQSYPRTSKGGELGSNTSKGVRPVDQDTLQQLAKKPQYGPGSQTSRWGNGADYPVSSTGLEGNESDHPVSLTGPRGNGADYPASSTGLEHTALRNNDTKARTLMAEDCSHSSYLLTLSQRLLAAHGVRLHALGKAGSEKATVPRRVGLEAPQAESLQIETLSMTGVFEVAEQLAQAKGESLFFESRFNMTTWDPSYPVTSAFFKSAAVRSVAVIRRNILDWNICRVRNCLDGWLPGVAVDAQGKEEAACELRRTRPSTPIFAKMNPEELAAKLQDDIRQRAEIAERLLRDGLIDEVFYAEDLLSFVRHSEGLGLSIRTWYRALKYWGISPCNAVIADTLRAEVMVGEMPDPGPHSQIIYNIKDVALQLRRHGLQRYLRT